jgi:hypothetical protein
MRYQKGVLCLYAVVLFLAAFADSAPGETLLRLDGETLTGNRIILPDDARGKTALLVISFSKKGGEAARAWEERFKQDFGTDQRYVIYPIAVLEDAPRFIRGVIQSGIRRGTPVEEQDRFVIVVRGEADLKRFVGYSGPDDAYALLIDSRGEVRWRGHGTLREQDYAALRDAAKPLAPQ